MSKLLKHITLDTAQQLLDSLLANEQMTVFQLVDQLTAPGIAQFADRLIVNTHATNKAVFTVKKIRGSRKQSILACLNDGNVMTVTEIWEKSGTDVTKTAINQALTALVKDNQVERVGWGKYKLTA